MTFVRDLIGNTWISRKQADLVSGAWFQNDGPFSAVQRVSYLPARRRFVAILESIDDLEGGGTDIPAKFHECRSANDERAGTTRSFKIRTPARATPDDGAGCVGGMVRSDVILAIFYRDIPGEPALLDEIINTDYETIRRYLLNPNNWARETSTIDHIEPAGDEVIPSEDEDKIGDGDALEGVWMTIPMSVTHDVTSAYATVGQEDNQIIVGTSTNPGPLTATDVANLGNRTAFYAADGRFDVTIAPSTVGGEYLYAVYPDIWGGATASDFIVGGAGPGDASEIQTGLSVPTEYGTAGHTVARSDNLIYAPAGTNWERTSA